VRGGGGGGGGGAGDWTGGGLRDHRGIGGCSSRLLNSQMNDMMISFNNPHIQINKLRSLRLSYLVLFAHN